MVVTAQHCTVVWGIKLEDFFHTVIKAIVIEFLKAFLLRRSDHVTNSKRVHETGS